MPKLALFEPLASSSIPASEAFDPFAKLLAYLQNTGRSAAFMELTQMISLRFPKDTLVPTLLEYLGEEEELNVIVMDALRFLTVDSVKCAEVLSERFQEVAVYIEHAYCLASLLPLLAVIAGRAKDDDLRPVLVVIEQRYLTEKVPEYVMYRGPIFSLLAEISQRAPLLTNNMVRDIANRCNQHANQVPVLEVVVPSCVCLNNIMDQPESGAYAILEDVKPRIFPKLALVIYHVHRQNDLPTIGLLLKTMMKFGNEFGMYGLQNCSENTQFLFSSAIIWLYHSSIPSLKELVRVFCTKFSIHPDSI